MTSGRSPYDPLLTGSLGLLIATPPLTLTMANGFAWLRQWSWSRIAEIACLAASLVVVVLFLLRETR